MRHDPTFHLRDGHPVAISHCSCGWIPSSHPPDTDEQFATHVAAAMLDHQGLGQAEIARRAEALAGWVTSRLVEGVEYRAATSAEVTYFLKYMKMTPVTQGLEAYKKTMSKDVSDIYKSIDNEKNNSKKHGLS